MRLGLVLLAVVVLLVASAASAGRNSALVPDEVKNNPPTGSYWDEELGLFVFDPPVPVFEPQSMITAYGVELKYDEGLLWYAVPPNHIYYALTRFPTPECTGEYFKLRRFNIACMNREGYDPEEGDATIYSYTASLPGCEHGVAEEIHIQPFAGLPYVGNEGGLGGIEARWTPVYVDPPVLLRLVDNPEFWVSWDYRRVPGDGGGLYTVGSLRDGLEPGDEYRFYEAEYGWPGFLPCPYPAYYGPWMIRALGDCLEEGDDPFDVDVKPTSCPNPYEYGRETGMISVALVAEAGNYPVGDGEGYPPAVPVNIDLESIYLEGPAGIAYPVPDRFEIEDVVAPYDGDPLPMGECTFCTTDGPDGMLDLTMKFEAAEIGNILGMPEEGTCVQVTLHYTHVSLGEMEGYDCFRVKYYDSGSKGKGSGPTLALRKVGDATTFGLNQNVPNPFKDGTTISFNLPSASHANLTIYDASGRTVTTLVNEDLSSGAYSLEWGAPVASGVYFCRLVAGNEAASTRMVMVR